MEKILVTGVGEPAGRAVAAFFRRHAYHVIGTDITAVNTEVDTFYLIPPGGTPEFPSAILRILQREKPFLFVPTVTEELVQAAQLRATIRGLGISMFIPDPEAVRLANDKYSMARALSSVTVDVPQTLTSDDVANAVEAGNTLGYPFIAKPRFGDGGREVTIHLDQKDAERELRREIVFQKFLEGEEYDVNLFVSPAGQPVVTRVLLKSHLREGLAGDSFAVQPVYEPEIAALAVRATTALNLQGPLDIDIRRDSDGVARILDINTRIGANVLQTDEVLESLLMHSLGELAQ